MVTIGPTIYRYPPGSSLASNGRSTQRYTADEFHSYVAGTMKNLTENYMRRRVIMKKTRPEAKKGTTAIAVDDIEIYAKSNAKDHHTDKFELVDDTNPVPLFRRGQKFFIGVRFKRALDLNKDTISLEFSFGPRPTTGKGTLITLPVSTNKEFTRGKTHWDVRFHYHNGTILTMFVFIPAGAPVGLWKLKVISRSEGAEETEVYVYKNLIYVLFNPWCKEDSVYMEDVKQREEYVLNDVGKIYIGTYDFPRGRRWYYGQFTDLVLPACMMIMEHSRLDYPARSNPIRMVRAIASIVNSIDKEGLIVPNWSGDYAGGVAPTMWTGSSAILDKYVESGGKPVKYGQCWVFAGVVTTICRALGIPTRCVTSYASAHDVDETMTIDEYFDEEGDIIEDEKRDTLWSFHVWNECWMSRPDLPSGYGGWQVLDVTPMEHSDGLYTVGPASVLAIRRGQIGFMFDTPLVFAEVNSSVVRWRQGFTDKGTEYHKVGTDYSYIGKVILTQALGLDKDEGITDAEDITSQYKDTEGTSLSERIAILNAARNGGLTYLLDYPLPEQEDLCFSIQKIERVKIGEPLDIGVQVDNKGKGSLHIVVNLLVSSVYYTGVLANKLKKEKRSFVLAADEGKNMVFTVKPEEYLDRLVDFNNLKIYVMAVVPERGICQSWCAETDFTFETPTLNLKLQSTSKMGTPVDLLIEFTNPLDRILDECSFTIEGPHLCRPCVVKYRLIKPKENVTLTHQVTPLRVGDTNITAIFNCRQLVDIVGSAQVQVSS